VSNVAGSSSHSMNHKTEGILLYPTVDVELSEKYMIKDHPISVFTVNLNVEWQLIHERMLDLLNN
jgi:5-methylcytosine-specific restriction enzyme subunit McrC